MAPVVSIIIPVYNVEKYLPKTLTSCLEQTFASIEIIVVNDGSTDNGQSIIEEFANKDSRIKIISKKNEGVTLARKEGLKVALGEYVLYLDGDDFLTPDAVEVLYQKAIETNADWVVADFFLDFEDGRREERSFFDFGTVDNIGFLKYCFAHRDFYFTGRLIRTSILRNADLRIPSYITFGEDNLAVTQLGYQLGKATKVNHKVLHYVQRGGSVTNQFKSESLINRIEAIQRQIAFVEQLEEYNRLVSEVHLFAIKEVYFQIVTGVVDRVLGNRFLKKDFLKMAFGLKTINRKEFLILYLASMNVALAVKVVEFLKNIRR